MTRQTKAVEGLDMVMNNAGGFTFKVSPMDQLDRFLILGSEANAYKGAADVTKDNAKNVIALLRTQPEAVIKRTVEISKEGRAPKNEYALFVLALAAADSKVETRRRALAALPEVARTPTHLFAFVGYVKQFRGWGRTLSKAVRNWYLIKAPDQLAYQVVKYQSRDGWANSDLLRLSHPKAKNAQYDAVFRWVTGGIDATKASTYSRTAADGSKVSIKRKDVSGKLPEIIQAFEEAKTAGENRIVQLILDHNLPREAVPTAHLNSKVVWEALLEKMPMTALIRNLATMTRNDVFATKANVDKVIAQVTNQEILRKSRIHPMNILSALRTYEAGRGVRGNNIWVPNRDITQALDKAFYKAFGNVTPTNKPTVLGIDVSGSMTQPISGFVTLTAREASMAMALITAAVEPNHRLLAFTPGGFSNDRGNTWSRSSVKEIEIDPKGGLTKALRDTANMPFAGTDCALPMLWADNMGYAAENFSVYTDNETYYGSIHPYQALKDFRKNHNVPAKLAVFGMTATSFSIADPSDAGMMDFAGFDSAAPQLASEFFSK